MSEIDSVVDDALELALYLGDRAGKAIREGYGAARVHKPDGSELTEIDLAVNDMTIEQVLGRYPSHRVLGEEASSGNPDSPWVWVCDPIDGTLPYTAGLPFSVYSLALCHEGVPLLGVIAEGATGTTWHARRGGGAWRGSTRLQVSSHPSIRGGRFEPSWGSRGLQDELRAGGGRLLLLNAAVRAGAAVAEGGLEGLVYTSGHPWDVAAASIIVEEAGGIATALAGGGTRLDRDGIGTWILAAQPVHDELVQAALRHGLGD